MGLKEEEGVEEALRWVNKQNLGERIRAKRSRSYLPQRQVLPIVRTALVEHQALQAEAPGAG